MSGGRYHCAYQHIGTLADELEAELDRTPAEPPPGARVWSRERRGWIEGEEAAAVLRSVDAERAWLVRVLRAVGKAAHDVEWVDSGDYGPGDEVEAIRAVRAVLEVSQKRSRAHVEDLLARVGLRARDVERGRIVAWLRRNPGVSRAPECITAMTPLETADAIERGEHEATGKDSP